MSRIPYVIVGHFLFFIFFSSRRRHTRLQGDWSSDVCSSDLFSGLTASSIKFSYIAVCQKFRKVPPRDRRRQARRGSTASARYTLRETASSGRALRFQIPTQLPFSPLSSSVWFLPPFAPRALPRFSATMASADCSPALTGKLSPGQVQNLSPRAVRLYRMRLG